MKNKKKLDEKELKKEQDKDIKEENKHQENLLKIEDIIEGGEINSEENPKEEIKIESKKEEEKKYEQVPQTNNPEIQISEQKIQLSSEIPLNTHQENPDKKEENEQTKNIEQEKKVENPSEEPKSLLQDIIINDSTFVNNEENKKKEPVKEDEKKIKQTEVKLVENVNEVNDTHNPELVTLENKIIEEKTEITSKKDDGVTSIVNKVDTTVVKKEKK